MLDLGKGIKIELTQIPAGKFQMGSASYDGDEKPVHEVTIPKPFKMSITTITQPQYEAVMGSNPSEFNGAELPVEKVTWHDAVGFCVRLSEKTGHSVRLPSEAEWEYACRAGSSTEYFFGDDVSLLGKYAWFEDCSEDKTHSVGQLRANQWGLFDMHGNVWEWCHDKWHDDYKVAPTDGSAWEGGDSEFRIFRGGSWVDDAGDCRAAYRHYSKPTVRCDDLGFRVVVQL